jgi:hypothetical protein
MRLFNNISHRNEREKGTFASSFLTKETTSFHRQVILRQKKHEIDKHIHLIEETNSHK